MDDAGIFTTDIERLREHAATFRKLAEEHAADGSVIAQKLREVAAELDTKADELQRLQPRVQAPRLH